MSLLRSFPPGTTHTLNDAGMDFLPRFVRARLEYLAEHYFNWYSDEVDGGKILFTYYEIRGKLADGYYSTPRAEGTGISPINFWIADECTRSLHLGGSACWICPSSHSLFFDAIDRALLPEHPDRNVWWCIQYEQGIKVVKILVLPAEEVTADFPDKL